MKIEPMTISFLSLLIAFKILVTFALVTIPFLSLNQVRLEQMTGTTAISPAFFRLYGVAVLGLLVGYASAFPLLQTGHFPWGVAIMGAVSNGGASFVLLNSSSQKTAVAFGLTYGGIFLGLILSMALPEYAMSPLL